MDYYDIALTYLIKRDEKKVELDFIDAELDAGCPICNTICKHSKRLIRLKNDRAIICHQLSTMNFAYEVFITEYIKNILDKPLNSDIVNIILSFR